MDYFECLRGARDRCFVTSQNIQINVCGQKAMYTASIHTILPEFAQLCLNVLERSWIMTDSQTIDVVNFHFKSTGARCAVCDSNDYPMTFILMHNFAM